MVYRYNDVLNGCRREPIQNNSRIGANQNSERLDKNSNLFVRKHISERLLGPLPAEKPK